ncbi:hypothetical protein LX36DRAFT_346379 [Colletotrichum falcatum]|nr:hypothetical protein LX36DRAFT_346379 [Colletotrichum falcatum]
MVHPSATTDERKGGKGERGWAACHALESETKGTADRGTRREREREREREGSRTGPGPSKPLGNSRQRSPCFSTASCAGTTGALQRLLGLVGSIGRGCVACITGHDKPAAKPWYRLPSIHRAARP